MKRRSKVLALLLALLLTMSAVAFPASAATLSKTQIARIEGILDLYVSTMWEYQLFELDGKAPTSSLALIAFDATKPVDAQMICASVEFLYYPATLTQTPNKSWMKPLSEDKDGTQTFSKDSVNKMCAELFGVSPKKHGYAIWAYNKNKGTYSIGGDVGESVSPKIKSYKTLKNGDIQVTAKHRSFSDEGKIYETGVTLTAVLRPSKTTTWGFTFRNITFTGTPTFK